MSGFTNHFVFSYSFMFLFAMAFAPNGGRGLEVLCYSLLPGCVVHLAFASVGEEGATYGIRLIKMHVSAADRAVALCEGSLADSAPSSFPLADLSQPFL